MRKLKINLFNKTLLVPLQSEIFIRKEKINY